MRYALAGIFLVILGALAYAMLTERTPIEKQPVSYWEDMIREKGAQEAYAYLIEGVRGLVDNDQHLTAHKFGDALYTTTRLEGVAVCDHVYGLGCFHQYFMSALYGSSGDAVREFSEACARKLGQGANIRACNHGLGHGVMVAFEEEGLERALDSCATIPDEQAFFGCIDGVFMEFFTPTHTGRDVAELPVRTFAQATPYEPCESLNSKFRPTCVYMMSSWWLEQGLQYEEAAALCRGLPAEYADACFKSLGHTMGFASSYVKAPVIAKCKEIAATLEEEVDCRAGAHWAFSRTAEIGVHLPEEDMRLCDFESPAASAHCLEESQMLDTAIGISVICCEHKL